MTPRQIALARHALGLPNARRMSYRNHFVAGVGHHDYEDWIAMVAEGNARRRAGNGLWGADDVFWLTWDGAHAALEPGERVDPQDFPPSLRASSKARESTSVGEANTTTKELTDG